MIRGAEEWSERDDVYLISLYGCFPIIMVPQNGWLIMENPVKMDDLGVPPFKEAPISFYI